MAMALERLGIGRDEVMAAIEDAEPGDTFIPVAPSATGARHMIGHYVTPLVMGALRDAASSSIMADGGMMDPNAEIREKKSRSKRGPADTARLREKKRKPLFFLKPGCFLPIRDN